jgi:hypothetical protein
MTRQLEVLSLGLLAALGLTLPGAMRVDAQPRTTARPRTAAQSRPLPRATVRSLVNGMAEMDPQAVKLDLDRYRVVQADQMMDTAQVGRLVELVDDNSTARRNQNLVTTLLRQSQRLSRAQTVVGADLSRRQLFVVDNRVIAPNNGIQ